MVDLEKHYSNLEPKKLVEILENHEHYKEEVLDYCKNKITSIGVNVDTLKGHSIEVIKKRFTKYFTEKKYLTDEPIFLDSYFLTEKEAKQCFKEVKEEYIKYMNAATSNLPTL